MYTPLEREKHYQELSDFLKTVDTIHTITRVGSGVTGFRDIYSDLDFMLSCETREDIEQSIDAISAYFYKLTCRYFKVLDFGWRLIYAILDNDLEFNVSLVTMEKTHFLSEQVDVVFSRDAAFKKQLEDELNNKLADHSFVQLDPNIDFLFLMHIRKYDIYRKRNDLIGALKELDEARNCILQVQAAKENINFNWIKYYNELDTAFQEKYIASYPLRYDFDSAEAARNRLIGLFLALRPDGEEGVREYLRKNTGSPIT